MSKLDTLRELINNLPPADLESHGVIQVAKTKANGEDTFICPACNNGGKGKTGDGLAVVKYHWGYDYKCFSCNKSFDTIKLLAFHYGLNDQSDFPEICKRAAQDFSLPFDDDFSPKFISTADAAKILNVSEATVRRLRDNDSLPADKNDNGSFLYDEAKVKKFAADKAADEEAAFKAKELELIKQTLHSIRDTASELSPDERRGIPHWVFNYFKCGVVDNWISPKLLARGKSAPPSRRLIIPTTDGKHYNAVLSHNDRKKFDQQYWKMHAGEKGKYTFGLQTLSAHNAVVFVTEGEIDAMSMYYAWEEFSPGTSAGFIATLGAAATAWYDELDKIFAELSAPPIIIFVADNDDTGKTQAEKHRAELLKRRYPTVVNFFSAGNEKVDANDFLRKEGAQDLAVILDNFYLTAKANLPKLKADIAAELRKIQDAKEKAAAELAAKERAEKEKAVLDKILNLPFSDAFNADRLFFLFGDRIRFSRDTEFWGFFEDGVWNFKSNSNSTLFPFARRVLDFIGNNRRKFPKAAAKHDERLYSKWQERQTQSNAIELLKGIDDILIRQSDLDKNPMLLNCKNGVLDLETEKLYPAAPELLLTKQCAAPYVPDATCELFEKFLQQIIRDEWTRNCVLRYLGYCLTGRVNAEKTLFVLGKGGNGKGTLFGTVQTLLNDYADTFKVDVLLKHRNEASPQAATPEIAKLEGLRFAYVPEIPPGKEFNLAVYKELTGGDKITARPLYKASYQFNPTHKFVLSGQYIPKVENVRDIGFLRRFLLVEFTEQFTGDKADPKLKAALVTPESLTGILALLVRECRAWNFSGFNISPEMEKVLKNYLAENDFIANFIYDNCEFGQGNDFFITRKAFLDRLKKEYSQAYRFGDHKLTEMISEIEGVKYETKGRNKQNVFTGVRFREDDLDAPPF